MKIKNFLLFLCCVSSITTFAQESVVGDIDNNLLQKYIALAQANFPRARSFDARVEKAKYAVSAAQMSWADIINAGYYYRPERNSADSSGVLGGGVTNNGQIITRGFLLGASVNLGSLLSKPFLVKSAKADYKAAKAESEEYGITLVNEVKSRYYDYLVSKKQLVIRIQASQSLKGLATDVWGKYEKGQVAIDIYTSSKAAAIEADALALTAEVTYLKAKNSLEDIIGAKLETIK